MAARNYVDNAPQTSLTGAISASDTSITLTSLTGYPASYPYTVTIDMGNASAEQILVTGAVSTTITATRNWNGQGAFSHSAGATVNFTVVAQDYKDANGHVNANSLVHGVTGSVVGTSDAQTLTNKTLTLPVIASISNTGTVTLPTATDTLVGRATTDTLTNKTLTSPTITGGTQASPTITTPTVSGLLTATGDATVGLAVSAIPGKAGIALRSTNVGNTTVQFSVDDQGNVSHNGTMATTGQTTLTGKLLANGGAALAGTATQAVAVFLSSLGSGLHFNVYDSGLTSQFAVDSVGNVTYQTTWALPQLLHGSASATIAASTAAITGTVTFSKTFSVAPDVTTGFDSNSQNIAVEVSSITTTGFSFRIYTTAGTNVGGSTPCTFHWIAAN